jgi:ABC-type branched-subunit amino acid transport system substrate-binding protein
MTSRPDPASKSFPAISAAVLFLLLAAPSAFCLTDSQQRGKRIYMDGKGRHEISAFLPGAGIKAPGAVFPCINCHLAGGAGQLEGGVQSADITWFNLTKEHAGIRPSGRAHPPYDDESVVAAIVSGQDPAGKELNKAHPLYEMAGEDLKDLVAYLKIMDREPVPGVTDNEVRVGILLPETGALAEAGREVEGLLSGYFAEVNARGGLYNRSLVLVPVRYGVPGSEGPLGGARKLLESDGVFCFLANIGLGPEEGTERYMAQRKVPVIVPLLSPPDTGFGTDRYTFHIFAGIRDQARVMVDFLAERPKGPRDRVGILFASDRHGEAGVAGAREQMGKHGLTLAAEASFPPGKFSAPDAAGRLRSEGVDAVLFFGGPGEALAFAREADRLRWPPLFLAPATMIGEALQEAPPGFLETAFLATPLAVPDPSSRRLEEFFRLGKRYGLGERHRMFQFLAFSGAILLEEGLKRSGRAVTREKFVDSIGNVWQLETGVTPPLTYNPNRRAGAVGAAILGVDPATRRYVPVSPWREPR